MKYTIKESVLKNIVKKVIRESIEASSQEQYILDELVPRVKSWMEDVYQDWGGVEAVSPDALTDMGNKGDFELAVEETANEFNIDYDLAYKLCLKSNEIAYEQFKAEHINEAKVVTKFTPYTPEEKEQNFAPFTRNDGRTVFQRNPSYEAALKAAQERRKQKVTDEAIEEAVKSTLQTMLKEDHYSYNGLERDRKNQEEAERYIQEQEMEKNYKKNINLFKRAYNKVYKEYSIIGTLKRKNPECKQIFSGEAFLQFVKETEGKTLYKPIWEMYGGEYEELADQYLQNIVVKLRKEMGI